MTPRTGVYVMNIKHTRKNETYFVYILSCEGILDNLVCYGHVLAESLLNG